MKNSVLIDGNLEVLKIALAPIIALAVAIIGWIITTSYNSTQQRIAIEKNKADAEIARVNAGIKFVEVFDGIPEKELGRRARLVAVSASILPSSLAFDLAVQCLDQDAGAIQALFAINGTDSWSTLEHHLAKGPVFSDAATGRFRQVLSKGSCVGEHPGTSARTWARIKQPFRKHDVSEHESFGTGAEAFR